MMDRLRVGFLPLVDAALLILAHEFGFAEDEGVALELVRDISWASVSDRLLYGYSDTAHMPAPLAIANTLGLGRPAAHLAAPFVLGLNGNAITMRPDIAAQITRVGGPGNIAETGARLADVIKSGNRLRFGVVHRYSSHNYMLRYWLRGCGMDPNTDVEIVTIAPPYAADALASGEVDGICVGEPWNSVSVMRGVGVIVAVTAQIWRRGVEKVLAVKAERLAAEPEPYHRLMRALWRAGEAFVDPTKIERIAAILARPEYLNGSAELIAGAVSDQILFAKGAGRVHVPDFMFQHREAANFPWVSQAAWLYAQMVQAGHVEHSTVRYDAAQAVFRPDVYRAALRQLGAPLPGASAKLEGGIVAPTGVGSVQGRLILSADSFFDGRKFDPDALDAYLAGG